MSQTFDELVVKFTADISGLKTSMDGASQQVATFATKTNTQLSEIEGSFRRMRTAAAAFGVTLSIIGVYEFGKSIFDAGVQVQSLQNRMLAATGDAKVAAVALAFVRQESNRLGLDLVATASGFANLSAAALRAGVTYQQVKDVFEGVALAATAMHLPARNVQNAFLALEEMASKGVVQLKEVRRQLAIDIPGSFEIAAKAMDLPLDKFTQMIHQGKITVNEFFPALARGLKENFGDAATQAADSAQASLNRFKNAWLDLRDQVDKSGFMDQVVDAIKEMTTELKDPQTVEGLKAFAEYLGDIAEAAVKAASAVGNFLTDMRDRQTAMRELSQEGRGGEFASGRFLGIFNEDEVRNKLQTIRLRRQVIAAPYNAPTPGASGGLLAGSGGDGLLSGGLGGANYGDYTMGKSSEGGAKGITDSKRHATEEQVRHIEEYGDDEGDKLKSQMVEHQKVLENALKLHVITKQKFNADMEAIQKDFDKRMASYVAKNFGDEIDVENVDYKERLKSLDKALKDKLITQKKYDELMEKAQKDHQKKLIKAENDFNSQMRSTMRQAMDGFLGIQTTYQERTVEEEGASFRDSISQAAQHNRTFFEIQKAAAIAQALLSARQSVVDAYKWGNSFGGPPVGLAMAAVAATAQAVNIAALASTSFGSSGGVSGGAGGDIGTTAPSDAQGPANVSNAGGANKIIHITIQGSMLPVGAVRDLIGQIQDAINDGTSLVTSS